MYDPDKWSARLINSGYLLITKLKRNEIMGIEQVALVSRIIRRGAIAAQKLSKCRRFSGLLLLNMISLTCSSLALAILLTKKHSTLKYFSYLLKVGEILAVSGACIGCLCDKIDGNFKWYYPFV